MNEYEAINWLNVWLLANFPAIIMIGTIIVLLLLWGRSLQKITR